MYGHPGLELPSAGGLQCLCLGGLHARCGLGDLIRHFGEDPSTESIVLYMESVGDAASFMAAARTVAAKKPIIAIKVGRTAEAARAAASHTGAMTGSDAVLDAALARAGVLRVDTIGELFDMAEVMAKQPLPNGPRLAILTNAGGPGALAADALVLRGGMLAELDAKTLQALDGSLPAHWSHGNPVDVLGDADAARYGGALRTLMAAPQADGLLAVLTPQAMTDPQAMAQALVAAARDGEKPVLASWMGGDAVESGREVLNAGAFPPTIILTRLPVRGNTCGSASNDCAGWRRPTASPVRSALP